MKTYIKLAWRNIWRNKRRTIITVASIFFAVFFALVMRAQQLGSYANMTNNIVKAFTGFIQVHSNGYWDDKIIDNTFVLSDEKLEEIRSVKNVNAVVQRIETFALASSGKYSKGVMLNGVILDEDDKLTNIKKKLAKGTLLSPDDEGVLVAQKLADFLKLDINDTLILIGQGYHGVSAAGKYPVRGLLDFPNPKMNSSMIFMSLPQCQQYLDAPNRLTSLAIDIEKINKMEETTIAISELLDNNLYEVMTWEKMLPELVQMIESDNGGGLIMLGILYMIIFFGVFGTVLMMTAERKKEFGVLIAIGMHRSKLAIILIIEMIFIGLVGIITGVLASLPLIYHFYKNPIQLSGEMAKSIESFGMEAVMPAAWQLDYFLNQSAIVMVIVLLSIIYPLISVLRINVIKAMRT